MILYGPRLLFSLGKAWPKTVGVSSGSAFWLIAAAITAAVWPAVGVVAGHICSAALGHEDTARATLRAAIGFVSVLGGALVMAPALTLILLWLSQLARATTSPGQSGAVAMGLLWPVWFAGVLLVVPPVFGLGPELGEVLWTVLAGCIVVRILRRKGASFLGIRRRWASRFIVHSTVAFLLLFVLVSVGPAMLTRAVLGASTKIELSLPKRPELPLPPEPNW